MKQVSYTNHIGRAVRDNKSGKSNIISNLKDLAAVEKHHNHDYTQEEVEKLQSDINLALRHYNRHFRIVDDQLVEITGNINLVELTCSIYEEIEKCNGTSGSISRPRYIDIVSAKAQMQIAVEGLIQIGDVTDWKHATWKEKFLIADILIKLMLETYKQLQGADYLFVVVGFTLHLNEGSPHIHYVGVPIQKQSNPRDGLFYRIKKSAVFNKKTLGPVLQDEVRSIAATEIQKAFGWEFKDKRTGRNDDLDKNTYINEKLKEEKKLLLESIEQLKSTKKQYLEEIDIEKQQLNSDLEKMRHEMDEKAKYILQQNVIIMNDHHYRDKITMLEKKIRCYYEEIANVNTIIECIPKSRRKKIAHIIEKWASDKKEDIKILRESLDFIKTFEQKNCRVDNPPSISLQERITQIEQQISSKKRDTQTNKKLPIPTR